MNRDLLSSLDWTLVQSFLAVADTGSLSGAARQLDQSQPTLGRQIKRLEDALGLDLFHRQPRGLTLTEQGEAILPAARRMAAALGDIALTAAGEDRGLSGTLRITASLIVSHFHLPEIIADLRAAAPEMAIELLPSDTSENLLFREADIAVRMYRSEQLDVVTRQIGWMPIGAYAAPEYLARKGEPKSPQDLMTHDVVGFDRSDLILRSMRDMGLPMTRDHFAVRCDDQVTYWELVRAGCGIGFGQRPVGDADPGVVRIFNDMPIPSLPVWLAAHDAMRRTPRVALAWDHLERGLAPILQPL
ncbi:LysR family transcriptional regulator [Pseudooceanicola sp. MF1-13]|uniref:LysR family transcriptional regulator n=1 Tax=Pseudooceanicola sp. MF1-13 TaxID=3379095 RepID=UPI003892724C